VITVLTAFLLALSAPHTLQAAEQVPLILTKSPVALTAFPLATGVPIPRGELWSANNARLISSTGAELPIQASALAKWPDGSIKSLLVRYRSALSDTSWQWWLLEYGPDVTPTVQESDPLQISETADRIIVNTGPIELAIGKVPFRIFDQVKVRLDAARFIGPRCTNHPASLWRKPVRRAPSSGPAAGCAPTTAVGWWPIWCASTPTPVRIT
jgi:hypothetical protein